jgi:osmotically inducible protein OsmC
MKRTASAVWQGTIREGQGTLSTQSRVLADTPYSFRSRFADGSETNPEELIGAAHAGCFAMALSGQLGSAGHPAERLDVTAAVSLEQLEGKWTIAAIHLDLKATVPGIEGTKFQQLAQEAKASCPVSRVLAGTTITLDAKLEGA